MRQRTIPLLLAGLAATSAVASDFVDTAQVISASPIMERISEPRQECYTEHPAPAQRQPERSIAAPILGGLAGALIGRQVGKGSGRDVATAVGAAVGVMAADTVANPHSDRSYTGATVGAVAGGILGSQVGGGSGRAVSTAAGTIAGTMVGDRVASRSLPASTQPVQRCRTVETSREVIKGYNVVYRYNGRDVATVLPYNPGSTVKVSVGIINDSLAEGGRELSRDRTPVSRAETYPAAGGSGYTYRY